MYKIRPSNEVHKKLLLGGNLSYWVHLFVQIEFIVLFCVRVESLDTLERTNAFLPLTEYTFLANKSCDFQTVKKVKIRRRRRTCADGDTDREILRQIVCEKRSDECAICRKILSKATKPSAACGGYSEAEQGQRSQSASALVRAPRDADTATRGFQREK